jgi:hypothetical protein
MASLVNIRCLGHEAPQLWSYKVKLPLLPEFTNVFLELLRLIHTYHAAPMPFPCHAALLTVQTVSFPFDLHSLAVFDSHMLFRTRAMPRPCRSERKFPRPRHSAGWAWHVWISIDRPETACGRPVRVRLLPPTTRSSTKVVIRSIPIC